MKGAIILGLVLAAGLLVAGCEQPTVVDPARRGPFYAPHNFVGDERMPDAIHRVLLLPVHGSEFAPAEEVEALDPVFATALEKQMRFEVVTLSRAECQASFGTPDISSAAALPHDFLQDLGRKYAADAVMFVDLTAYQPYRPIVLGVRAKLATIGDHRLVWSFDEVFFASNPAVDNAVRRFFIDSGGGPMPIDMTAAALQSPTKFAAYASDAAFKTLPPR
jgi:hypothetical protein